MKRQIGWILCFVVPCHALFAPPVIEAEKTDRVKKLLEEVVQFENGKMTIREFGLLSFPWAPDEKIQLGFYSEAPKSGVVSRDNFVRDLKYASNGSSGRYSHGGEISNRRHGGFARHG